MTMQSGSASIPLQDATAAQTRLAMSVGDLRVSGGAEPSELASGVFRVPDPSAIRKEYSVDNGTAVLKVHDQGANIGFNSSTSNITWGIKLNDTVPTSLDVNCVAGQCSVDLTGMEITSLNNNLGVGQTIVTLPEGGGFSGKIGAAVGEIVVRVPRSQAVNLNLESAITAVDLANGFQREGNTVTNTNAKEGAPIDLTLNSVIGSIRVEYAR
jgi:hypothetical protein